MLRRLSWFVVLALGSILFSKPSMAKCVLCMSDDYASGDGYKTSDFTECDKPNTCFVVSMLRATAFLDSLGPGLTVREASGRVVVSSVIPGAPADQSGIAPGDEIVSVNGQRAAEIPCPLQTWGAPQNPKVTFLVIKHGRVTRRMAVGLVTVRSILSRNWNRAEGSVQLVSLRSREPSLLRNKESYGPYVIGIQWVIQGSRVQVSAVLSGSPAYEAGITPGDTVTRINGETVGKASQRSLSELTSGEGRYDMRLTVLHAKSPREVSLESKGLTRILRDISFSATHVREAPYKRLR